MRVLSKARSPARALCVPALTAALFAGCGSAQTMPRSAATLQGAVAVPASIVLRVPSSVSSSALRRLKYVAATSKSAKFTFAGAAGCTSCTPAATVEFGLVIGAGAPCVAGPGGTTCTLTLNFRPGAYVAGLVVYDGALDAQLHVTGKPLSEKTSFPIQVLQGSANTTSLVLDGVPASIVQTIITPHAAYSVTGNNGTTPYTIDRLVGNNATAEITVNAKDADGNVIVGPGSPIWSADGTGAGYGASVSGNNVTITGPAAYTKARGTLGITANSPACSDPAAVCTLPLQLGMAQTMAVTDGLLGVSGGVVVWGIGATSATVTRTGGINGPSAVTFGPDGTMFVANSTGGNVLAYAPPYTGSPVTMTDGVTHPHALLSDSAKNLFIANSPGTTTIFAAPYQGASVKVTAGGVGLAFDPQGDLWLSTGFSGVLQRYAFPFAGTAPLTQITVPESGAILAGITVTPSGTLYVADGANNVVLRYDAPYTGAPQTFTGNAAVPMNQPASVGVAPDGTLLVGGTSGLTVFSAAGVRLRTLTGQVGVAQSIAFDDDGVAWIASFGPSGPVGVPYPYDGTGIMPLTTSTTTFKQPNAIAIF